jgi:hypothetical protein
VIGPLAIGRKGRHAQRCSLKIPSHFRVSKRVEVLAERHSYRKHLLSRVGAHYVDGAHGIAAPNWQVLMDELWAVLHGMAALYLDRSAAFDPGRARDCVAKLLLGTRAQDRASAERQIAPFMEVRIVRGCREK